MRNRLKGMLIGVAALAAVGVSRPSQAAICGDVSGNGAVGSGDAVLLLQFVAGLIPGGPLCGGLGVLQCGDLNASGTITIADVVILQNVILGNPTLFPPCSGVGPSVACGATLPTSITSSRRIQKCTGCDQPGTPTVACSAIVDGTTFIQPGVTLTVDAGAVVCGKKASATPSALVFLRDAKINAAGVPCMPIIFTSDQPEGSKGIGDWGGIVINGRANSNCAAGSCLAEGLTGVEFGGPNPNDSSGVMRFVRVEFSGKSIGEDNELNIITLNGVGRGSDFTFLQANMGFDDGIEWFGGTVDHKFIVSSGAGDDQFDWQIGYTGRNQFGFAIQRSSSLQSGAGRQGYEADNNENDEAATPVSDPRFCNISMCGTKDQGDTTAGRFGGQLRRGTKGILANQLIQGFSGAGICLDGTNSAALACGAGQNPRIQDSLFFDNGPDNMVTTRGHEQASTGSGCTAGAACSSLTWYNTILGPTYDVLPATSPNDGPPTGVDCSYPSAITNQFVPTTATADLNAPNCSAELSDAFYDAAPYKGAFQPAGGTPANWLSTCPATPRCEWVSFDTN